MWRKPAGAIADLLLEISAVQELHDQVPAAVVFTEVIDPDDSRVPDDGTDACFLLELSSGISEKIERIWSIENRDHHVKDVTLGEDRCCARTGALPAILAPMRSHAISALRLLGFTNIAQATRWARDDFTHPLTILGLI